jgi:hypothetical protein
VKCPYRCRYDGAVLFLDSLGHRCQTHGCSWAAGVPGCRHADLFTDPPPASPPPPPGNGREKREHTPRGAPIPTAPELERVLAVLKASDGPVRKNAIRRETGLDERFVRACLADLTLRGEPVVADYERGGYELTMDQEKLRREVARLFHRAREIRARATALAKHIPDWYDVWDENPVETS